MSTGLVSQALRRNRWSLLAPAVTQILAACVISAMVMTAWSLSPSQLPPADRAVVVASEMDDVTSVFLGSAIYLSILIVGVTMNLAIQQQLQDIALVRVVGASPGQVRRAVALQVAAVALPASLLGWLIAVPAGAAWIAALRAHGVLPTAARLSRLEVRVSDPEVEAIVATARQLVLDALEELREIIRGVHPPALDDGLSTALATLAARSPVLVELQDEHSAKPSDVVAAALYFTAAELITNVARHADADRARVEIHDDEDRIWLVVSDDGHGGASLSSHGTGLAGVERRLRALDGTMSVDSPPHGPTTITVTLPRGAS